MRNNRGAYRSSGSTGGAGAIDPHGIGTHTDVEITNPQNDDILRFQTSDGKWHNLPSTVTLANLDDLANVDTTGKADADILRWDQTAGNWVAVGHGEDVAKFVNYIGLTVNRPPATPDNQGVTWFATDSPQGGTLYESDGSQWVKISKGLTEGVDKADFLPDSVIGADGAGTPGTVVIGGDQLLGRAGATDMAGLTKAQVLTIINVTEGAQPTGPTEVDAAGAVMETDYLAQSVLVSVSPNAPTPVAFLNGQLLGRGETGDLKALSKAEVLAVLNVTEGAEPNQSDAEILAQLLNVDGTGSGLDADMVDGQHANEFASAAHTHGEGDIVGLVGKYVPNALYDPNSILVANIDDTPTAIVVGEDRIVGRLAGGFIAPLTGAQIGSLIRLNDLAAPSANYDMNGKTLTNLLGPTNPGDAARWQETFQFRIVKGISSVNYTFVLDDAGALVRFDLNGAQTATIPPNSTVAYPTGTRITLHVKDAAGQLTVQPGAGVTLDAQQTVLAPHDSATLVKTVAPDTWAMTTSAQAEESLPPGGLTGQVLKKVSGTDFDVAWLPDETDSGVGGPVPDGGLTGQHLAKVSNADQDLTWEDPPTFSSPVPTDGTTGQILAKASNAAHDMEWIDDVGIITDLSHTQSPTDVTIESSDGQDTTVPGASQTLAGFLIATDKAKLDNLTVGADLPPGGATGQVLKKIDGTDYNVEWANETGGGGGSPLIAKGDLFGFDTADARIPVGADGQVLTADSAEATGVKWAAAAGGGIPETIIDAKGDLIAGAAADTAARLAAGTDGMYLTAQSGEATGLKWIELPPTDPSTFLLAGTTASRPPASSVPWAYYYDTDNLVLEQSNGTAWIALTIPQGDIALDADLTAHTNDTNNPHGVNAAQAGADPAGSAAAVQTNLDTHEADTLNPHSVTAVQAGADPAGSAAGVQTNLDTHEADNTNPHSVTAAQAGADPVGSAAAVQSNLDTHEAASNPHNIPGVPAGGSTGHVLKKLSGTDFDDGFGDPAHYETTNHGNVASGTLTINPTTNAPNPRFRWNATGAHTIAASGFVEGDYRHLEVTNGDVNTVTIGGGFVQPDGQTITWAARNHFVAFRDGAQVVLKAVAEVAT